MRAVTFSVLALAAGLAACASTRDPAATPDAAAETDPTAVESAGSCPRRGMVTVLVDNRSSFDVWIAFGPWRPARAATGFARTTYTVSRSYLENYEIVVGIERGGLAVRPPTQVQTEWVICNDATLVIGSRPEYSFFYGDRLREPIRETDGDTGEDDATAPADSADAPADSASGSSVPESPESE
jgi:hypothetical protein